MPQRRHAILPRSNHDERARQAYVADLRFSLLNEVGREMQTVYEERVAPAFQNCHGRLPKDKYEVHSIMMQDHYAQTWSSLMRSCQEMMWGAVTSSIERQFSALNSRALEATSNFSTLELNEDVRAPDYLTAVDIHCMPGNYHTSRCDGDVAQGALYDHGVYVYQMGFAGETVRRHRTFGCGVHTPPVSGFSAQKNPRCRVHRWAQHRPVLRSISRRRSCGGGLCGASIALRSCACRIARIATSF